MQRRGVAPRVAAEQADVAGVLAQQPEQHPDGRRLAGAVGAEEAVHLAPGDGEVEPVQGPRSVPNFLTRPEISMTSVRSTTFNVHLLQ